MIIQTVSMHIHHLLRIISHIAMVTLMDESIGNITETLYKSGMIEDAITIFQSDVSTIITQWTTYQIHIIINPYNISLNIHTLGVV